MILMILTIQMKLHLREGLMKHWLLKDELFSVSAKKVVVQVLKRRVELEPQQPQDQQLLKISNQHLGWELLEVDQLIRLNFQI